MQDGEPPKTDPLKRYLHPMPPKAARRQGCFWPPRRSHQSDQPARRLCGRYRRGTLLLRGHTWLGLGVGAGLGLEVPRHQVAHPVYSHALHARAAQPRRLRKAMVQREGEEGGAW